MIPGRGRSRQQFLLDQRFRNGRGSENPGYWCSRARGFSQQRIDSARVPQPALTRTCRQIRAETLPVFYGSHRFVLMLPSYYRWVSGRKFVHPSTDAIVPGFVALLRHIGIVYVRRKQLGWIKTVLLPDMKQKGFSAKTVTLATTYRNTYSYDKCGCMYCAWNQFKLMGPLYNHET